MNKMNTSVLRSSGYREAAIVVDAIHGDYSCTVVRFKRTGADNSDHGLYVPCGYNHGTLTEHAELFPNFADEGIEPFLVAGATDGLGHADANVTHTWVLCVDFDRGYPGFLANPLIGPSLLVETSPSHYHAMWILDQSYSVAETRPVLKAMALRLGGDLAYAKPSQLIRLPGFLNVKRETVARLVEPTNLAKPYTLDFLKDAFDVDLIINGVRSALPRFNSSLDLPRHKDNENDAAEQAADVASALPYLKDYAENYDDWVSTLMALVPLGKRGKQLGEEFSRYSTKFDQQAFEKKWNSLKDHPGRVATIFLRAQNNGWKNPGFRHKSVDANKVFTDRKLGRLIASKLGDDFAATANTHGKKNQITLLRWNGDAFLPMSDIDRRKVVEEAGNQVVKGLADNGLNHEAVVKLKHKLGNNRTLDDVCEHVAEELIPRTSTKLVGKYPYFAAGNGVINTLTQELVPARFRPVPSEAGSLVTFDPTATAPTFERVVREVFEGDQHLIDFFYRVMGYAMQGKPIEQIFLVLFGPSSGNGKNTLMEAVQNVFGNYAVTLPTNAIMTKSHVSDGATPSLARLEGKRLAVVSEPNNKHAFDSGLVKQMTGDRSLPTREMYGATKDILIEFVLAMSANFIPELREDDKGMWRRLRIIPFNRAFTEEEKDTTIPDSLRKEASGILNLLLAGVRDFMANGLRPPAKVLAASSEHRKSVDPIANFIEETMLVGVNEETPLKMIYPMYETWSRQNPDFPRLTKQQISKKLEEKGHKKSVRGNLPYFHGLRPIDLPD